MSSGKLLIIEDDKINAFILKKFLNGVYDADIASSPGEALELAKADDSEYPVVLMDINLGDDQMDGIDLLREFRTIPGYEKTPVIATTAYAMTGDREKFLEKGFDEYLAKPIQKSELMTLIERFCP